MTLHDLCALTPVGTMPDPCPLDDISFSESEGWTYLAASRAHLQWEYASRD